MALVVIAQNISDLAEDSTYEVEVSINRQLSLFNGKVEHRRSDGAAALLRLIADRLEKAQTQRLKVLQVIADSEEILKGLE